MSRALLGRLTRPEAAAGPRDAAVHVVPAGPDEEFREKRAGMIEAGQADDRDCFIHASPCEEAPEPVTVARSLDALFADIAAKGRRIFDPRPEVMQ